MKTIVNGTAIIVISLLLFCASTWWRMQEQFGMGESALRDGDFTGAVAGYESAIHMYLPSCPTIEQAAQQLWNIGNVNEASGDINRAPDRLSQPAKFFLCSEMD